MDGWFVYGKRLTRQDHGYSILAHAGLDRGRGRGAIRSFGFARR
jgi:hypothetical protein